MRAVAGVGLLAVGDNGTIVRYSGDAWELMPTPTTVALNGVFGDGFGRAFAVGALGTVLEFNGESWELLQTPTTARLNGIGRALGGIITAVGDNSTVLSLEGGVWVLGNAGTGTNLNGLSRGIIVGDRGTILLEVATTPTRETTWGSIKAHYGQP